MSIQRYYDAAANAQFGSLDRPIYRDVDIGIQRFESRKFKKVYVDVPVDKIFALNRSDFWETGETWRQAVHSLIGKGWGDDTLQYFAHPLLDNSFPAPNSRNALQLAAVGGLCYCTNGNHRLVAGRALLTQLSPKNAQFQLAKVIHYELEPHTKKFIFDSLISGSSILTAKIDWNFREIHDYPYDLYLTREDTPNVLYARSHAGIFTLSDERNFVTKLLGGSRLNALGACEWLKTPTDVLAGLLDDAWIVEQTGSANTW